MNKAKEFYNNGSLMESAKWMKDKFQFAEDYHQSRVKAINEQHVKDLDEIYESGRKDGFNTSAL